MNTYVFSLSDKDIIKKEWENSRLRTSGQSGQDPYKRGWMASCRIRTCCANLPVSVVHTYTQHEHTHLHKHKTIFIHRYISTQKHECTSTLLHAYESTRPHTLSQKCLNRLVSLWWQMEAVSMPWVSCSKWEAHEVVFLLCDYSHMLTVLCNLEKG